jgi:saccharopine dehydrogenase (NAD+, L-lysine-forming)
MPGDLLIYGANGFTGELIAREAVHRGLAPILAGRNAEALRPLATELGLPSRIAAIDDPAALAAALAGVRVVLHAAGPFVLTSRPMLAACLAARAHYLDITGEIVVFEEIFRRDAELRDAGIGAVPGVGFDVVPSDALAAELGRALPSAERLDLAFASIGGSWSRGTLVTMIEGLPAIGWERRDGRLVAVRPFSATLDIELPGLGRRRAVQIPWGDLATAYRTTGIPNVRTFTVLPPPTLRLARLLVPFLGLLGRPAIRRRLQARVRRRVTGPSAEIRRTARIALWGRATAPDGSSVTRSLSVPEGYTITALAAVECARRALAGDLRPGAATPSRAFGPELLAALPGVAWD